MKIGKMRHRVEIQTINSENVDVFGNPLEAWLTKHEVWCRVQPITGQEYWEGEKVSSKVSHRITMRAIDGLDTTMRIKWDRGTPNTIVYFNIASIKDIEGLTKELEILGILRDS